MYSGLVELEDTLTSVLLVTNSVDTPLDADALPTFRVYGPDGFLVSGTCSLLEQGTITDASNASPIVITSVGHGLTTGSRVTISGVGGNTAANGTFVVTRLTADTFRLDSSAGSGAYTSGGTFHPTGAYGWSVPALGADGFEQGENYSAVFDYALSSVAQGQLDTFTVV